MGLQEEGLDTVDANRALGLPDDCREYSSVRNILSDLEIKSIRLMVCCALLPNNDLPRQVALACTSESFMPSPTLNADRGL